MDFRLTRTMPIQPVIEAIKDMCEKNPLGVKVRVTKLKPQYTRKEERTLHWMLSLWLDGLQVPRSDSATTQLKHKVCETLYGTAMKGDLFGNEIPVTRRTTTTIWVDDRSHPEKGYYADMPMTVEEYAEVISRTQQVASDSHGIVLPDPDPTKAKWFYDVRRKAA